VHETNAAYQKNAEHDRRITSKEIAESCGGRGGSAFLTCITEALETYYSKQATNEDLQAQQDMAFWAKWMMYISAATAAVTAAGVWYVARTLEETRRANEIMGEAYLTDQRPWLALRISSQKPLKINNLDVSIELACFVKNIGKTPATIVNLRAIILPPPSHPNEVSDRFMAFCEQQKTAGIFSIGLMPNDNPKIDLRIWAAAPEFERHVHESENGDCIFLMIFACVTYKSSIDKELHQTGLVYRLSRGVEPLYWFPVPNCEIGAEQLHIIPFEIARNVVT